MCSFCSGWVVRVRALAPHLAQPLSRLRQDTNLPQRGTAVTVRVGKVESFRMTGAELPRESGLPESGTCADHLEYDVSLVAFQEGSDFPRGKLAAIFSYPTFSS
jgi:hypothetical protein